jgi:hypothetical protein
MSKFLLHDAVHMHVANEKHHLIAFRRSKETLLSGSTVTPASSPLRALIVMTTFPMINFNDKASIKIQLSRTVSQQRRKKCPNIHQSKWFILRSAQMLI